MYNLTKHQAVVYYLKQRVIPREAKPMFYTIEEVAKMLKVSEATVRRLIRNGQLEAIPVGSQYRISQEGLDKFLSRRKK